MARGSVGKPSNSWGNKYRAIYSAAASFEKKNDLKSINKVFDQIHDFLWSKHTGATTESAPAKKTTKNGF